jgi:hypothetical protein
MTIEPLLKFNRATGIAALLRVDLHRRDVRLATAVVAWLTMFALYTRLAWTVPMTSDNATVLLQAQDFVQGNYLLRGWHAGNFSVYLTELPYYVVGLIVAGFTPSLLRSVPALLFTLLLTLSVLLVHCETPNRSLRYTIGTTFVLLALPWGFSPRVLLVSFLHMGTILMLVAAFVCIALLEKRPSRWWLIALYLTILTSAVCDDEFAIYVGVLPILVVLVVHLALELPSI